MTSNQNEPVLRLKIPNYEALGLKGNPFPITGVSTSQTPYPLIDRLMDDEVHAFINDTLQSGQYCGFVILGEFGAGKTYALRYIETLLRTIETRPDAEEVLAVYLERPRATTLGLVSDVCNRIGRIRIRNLLLEMILSDLAIVFDKDSLGEAENRARKVTEAFRTKSRQTLFDQSWLEKLCSPEAVMNPSAALDNLYTSGEKATFLQDFATDSVKMIIADRDHRADDLAYHLARFALAEPHEGVPLWNSFLDGKIVSSGKSFSSASGQDVWSSIKRLLTRAGYKMIYWLIDEFEELEYELQRKATSVRAFLSDLRDLIDSNLEGFALVLASKYHPWDVYRKLHPAFSQRFPRIINLPPSNNEDLRHMIENRLAAVRIRSGQSDSVSVLPFTQEAIDAIQRLSGGNPRVAVETCHILLWHVAVERKERITEDTVANWKNINRAYFYARQGGWDSCKVK